MRYLTIRLSVVLFNFVALALGVGVYSGVKVPLAKVFKENTAIMIIAKNFLIASLVLY
jgi:hypothetical protein